MEEAKTHLKSLDGHNKAY